MKNLLNKMLKKYFFRFDFMLLNAISKICALLSLALFLMIQAAIAQAPNISYNSPQVYNPLTPITALNPMNTGGAVPSPYPIVRTTVSAALTCLGVDTAGNLYAGETSSSVITKIVGTVSVSLGSGLLNPSGVAVDTAGNIYVADFGHNAIKEILIGTGTTNTLLTVTAPKGMAIDAQRNIYFCSGTSIYKLPAGGNTATAVATGFSNPVSIAVDASKNIYVADPGSSTLTEVLASNSSKVTVATVDNTLTGVGVAKTGDVYFSDSNLPIMVFTAGGGPELIICPSVVGHHFMAVQENGNVFTDNDLTIDQVGLGYYTVSPTLPQGITLNSTYGEISGTPVRVTAAANYTVTARNGSGTGTAVINIAVVAPAKPNISYKTPVTLTVGTSNGQAPITPTNSGGYIPGLNPITVGTLTSPQSPDVSGVAVDAAGNVYAADQGSTSILKYPPGGAPVNIGSGFSNPRGIAIDASGNVFVVDNGNKVIKEILAGSSSTITYATGFTNPIGIAIDAGGNLYVSDATKGAIYKVPVGGGAPAVLVSGFNSPAGVGVDPAGNVYFACKGGNVVRELPASGTSSIVLATGFNAPYGIAVDPAGNVFVGDSGNSVVKRIPAGGGAPFTLSYTLKTPMGVALDANGNIYVSDWGNAAIYELNPGWLINPTPSPGLTFIEGNGLIYGTPTVASSKTNYTISARNAGGISVATVEITVNPAAATQPATLSYNTPQTYADSIAIPPLTPRSTIVPSPAIGEGTTTTVATVTNATGSIVTDTAGNLYVATVGGITKIPPVGGNVTLIPGTAYITGISIDHAGNLYGVSGSGPYSAIMEIKTDGTIVSLTSAVKWATTTAVDGLGNVYVYVDDQTSRYYPYFIYKIAAGTANATIVAEPTGFSNVGLAVAVDKDGNIFAIGVGGGNESIIQEYPGNYGGTALNINNQPIYFGSGIITDQNGNVYFASAPRYFGTFSINVVSAANHTPQSLVTGTSTRYSLYPAVDLAGNLYVLDISTGVITKTSLQNGYSVHGYLPVGLKLNPQTGVISGTPFVTNPATNYTITGYGINGSASATVNIATVAATNTSLTNLAISSGTLSPAFASATTNYSVTIPYSVSAITLTPTTSGGTASVLVNSVAVASGTASSSIPLALGVNTIQVTVTDNGGTTATNYVLTVTRSPSAALANFTVSPGAITPAFSSGTYNYTTTLPGDADAISITPTLVDSTATITINGKGVATGTASPNISLAFGPNTITTVTTTADGSATLTYTLTAIRPSANANLATLGQSVGGLTPGFSSATTSYTDNVSNATTSITLKPVTSDATATMKVNGVSVTSGTMTAPIALTEGVPTVITTVVTAQNGVTTKTYTLTVNRAASTDATLSALKLSTGTLSPAFASTTTTYTANIGNAISSVTVTPTANDAHASIKVNGTIVASGTPSTAITINEGATTTINVTVTAQNGTTIKTYKVAVTRAPSSNANLSKLGPSISGITPYFSSGMTSYTISTGNANASMTLTPASIDANATIKVNGTAVASGATTSTIALAVGSNTIATQVTAQDGITTKTYTLTVTRAASGADSYVPGISVTKPTETPIIADDGILVHQGLSPNGDGVNDFLMIDNISQYPDNKLMVMNRNGQLIYETQGYDNRSKVFDGHSNKNGQMQLPGTYFYQLDYTAGGIAKHKTGFLLLKY